MKTRKEDTPYKVNSLLTAEQIAQFKDDCFKKYGTGMSPVVKMFANQFIRGEFQLKADKNITLEGTPQRFNMMVDQQLLQDLKDKCKEQGDSVSQWIKTLTVWVHNN